MIIKYLRPVQLRKIQIAMYSSLMLSLNIKALSIMKGREPKCGELLGPVYTSTDPKRCGSISERFMSAFTLGVDSNQLPFTLGTVLEQFNSIASFKSWNYVKSASRREISLSCIRPAPVWLRTTPVYTGSQLERIQIGPL